MGWLHYGISCQWLHGHGYIQYCDMRGIMALCMAKLMRGTESMAEGEARLSRHIFATWDFQLTSHILSVTRPACNV